MNHLLLKSCLPVFIAVFASLACFSQTAFNDNQKNNYRVGGTFNKLEDSLKRQFEEKKLAWPPQSLYIRSFKYDRQLEVWVKNGNNESFKLFKTYKVCMQSGTTGPKRMEGDYQIPEGFYYINEFNPNSKYHLSLGLNYPNASDRILSDSIRPGGSIYIHGNCVSTGCIAISDIPIEELFIIATRARANGQDFIPVHVFPVRYDVKKSLLYLAEATIRNQVIQKFAIRLKEAFDYFEEKRQLPVIMVSKTGEYVIN
ncbi:MAG: L,D-transpeptidase family protein [Ferruginibacter sp.]|nr:L,D-transpeptidase family protein [Ferruginibacter sp.]